MKIPESNEPYPLWGTDILFSWLVGTTDRELSDRVVLFVYKLTEEPDHEGTPVPGYPVEVLCANVPETDVWVTWYPDHQRRRLWLVEVEDATDLWGGIGEE